MFTLMCTLTVKLHEPCLASFWGAWARTQAMSVSKNCGLIFTRGGVEG